VPQIIAVIAAKTIFAKGIIGFISRVIFSQILGSIADRLSSPDAPAGTGISGRDITVRGTLEYRKVVYGTARLSGPNVYPNVSGADREDLWFVIPLSHGRSESIEAIWIDDVRILASDIDWTPGSGSSDGTGTGAVTDSAWQGPGSATAVFCYWYLGYDDQPVCGPLNAAFVDIALTHRGRGITYFIVRCRFTEATKSIWEKGAPQNVRAELKGRLVYDPRLDSTNGGSGSHRYADSTTWAWSENPALCVSDYLITYQNVSPSVGINWPAVVVAADASDVTVSVPSATQNRFTCNGSLSLGVRHITNIENLLSSMAGKWGYWAGQFTIRASVWSASVASFGVSDIAGKVVLQGSRPTASRWNVIKGFYVDPDRSYAPVEFQQITASEFTVRDNNKELSKDIQLPFTNDEWMAQRIAYRLLEQGDNQESFSCPMMPVGLKVVPGDVVDWTISEVSYSAKTFRITKWAPTAAGEYELSFQEDDATRYADPLVGEYVTKSGGSITIPSVVVSAPTSLTATSQANGILLAWTNPASRLFEQINIYESSTSAWAGASLVATVRGNSLTIPYAPGTARWFWITAVNFEGVESLRNPDNDTSTITAVAGVSVIDVPVINDFADGSVVYTAGTQPRIEASALNQTQAFTSPSNINTRCLVNWTVQGQASNSASGVAVGESRLRIRINVNAVQQYSKYMIFDGFLTANGLWATLSGSFVIQVPAGQDIDVFLESFRNFSTSGTSPAQTHYWQNGVITITPLREAIA